MNGMVQHKMIPDYANRATGGSDCCIHGDGCLEDFGLVPGRLEIWYSLHPCMRLLRAPPWPRPGYCRACAHALVNEPLPAALVATQPHCLATSPASHARRSARACEPPD